MSGLKKVTKKSPHVKEVRGKGLLIGIETESKAKALQLQELGREKGLLLRPVLKNQQ